MLRSPPAPNSLCAFETVVGEEGYECWFSLFGVGALRPGKGKANFEVRPIVYDSFKPADFASNRWFLRRLDALTVTLDLCVGPPLVSSEFETCLPECGHIGIVKSLFGEGKFDRNLLVKGVG